MSLVGPCIKLPSQLPVGANRNKELANFFATIVSTSSFAGE